MTLPSTILGFSRMGPNRELKKRVETFWKESHGVESTKYQTLANDFHKDVEKLQLERWSALKATGLSQVPADYSLYDHVLDLAFAFGVVPQRYRTLETQPTVRTYFAMARGLQEPGYDVAALPMKKWFDTNYHYIVPELAVDQSFTLQPSNKYVADVQLAKSQLQLKVRPTLVGPITFLHLSHVIGAKTSTENLKLLNSVLPAYVELIKKLVSNGVEWIQIDEPVFALSFSPADAADYQKAFADAAAALQLAASAANAHILFTTFFGGIISTGNAGIVANIPKGAALHLDLVRAADQLDVVVQKLPAGVSLSLGVVDGREVWITPLAESIATVKKIVDKLGKDRVLVATSCSLLHVPWSTQAEHEAAKNRDNTSQKVLQWLSFGLEKCVDVVTIARAASGDTDTTLANAIKSNSATLEDRRVSPLIHNAEVQKRIAEVNKVGAAALFRKTPFAQRVVEQQKQLKLPVLPTTTIGSFPQSAEVRQQRANFKAGRSTAAQYQKFINEETERCVRIQEEIGLDVLVHGEFERNDMVEFFAENMHGYFVSVNGWVQSYGSRCVKPAVLYGDIQRHGPMTVDMIKYAQSLTNRPLKGMLTGPTTIVKWSFVRNDQPLRDTVFQVALAIRDEVTDLEAAGIKCIQVDEPGFREGLPLDGRQHADYLKTTVEAFKISTGSVRDATQIFSHMCYSDFGDIFTHIADLDADVLCIECSRSELDLLECFDRFGYPLMVGPGLYDIHSPRVPTHDELKSRLLEMSKYIPAERLFANPDCGLKTRAWPETKAALKVLVDVVKEVRQELAKAK